VYRLTWRLPLAGLVAFSHLQFSQIRGRQPYLIVRNILYVIQRFQLTGVPTSTWYDLQNAGLAPKPIKLSPRTVGWLIEELAAWVEARKAERDARVAS